MVLGISSIFLLILGILGQMGGMLKSKFIWIWSRRYGDNKTSKEDIVIIGNSIIK